MTSDLFRRYIDIVTEADQQSQYHPLVTDIDSLGLTFQPTTKKDLTYSPVKVALNQKNLDQMPALSFGTSADSFVLQTVTDDGHETTKPVTQGDVIVSGPGKEKYNIGNQAKFDKNYPIDAGKGRRKPDINSVRQVAQYTGQKPISIIASWGEQMNVLPGDYIVNEAPGKYYRVAKYLFDQTYNALGRKQQGVAEGSKRPSFGAGIGDIHVVYMDGKPRRKFKREDDAIDYADDLYDRTGNETIEVQNSEGGVVYSFLDEQQGVAEGTKSLADYIAQSERAHNQPVTGDYFEINIKEDTLFETWVCDETEDGIVIYADHAGMKLLESHGYLDPGLHESQQLDEILPVLGAVAGRALAGSMGLGNLGKTAAGIAGRAAGAALSNTDDDKVAEGDHAHNQDIAVRDAGEYDQEGDMAKDDLATIVRAARRLTGMLDDDENMPEWVQAKINKAADYVDTAADYIESNKERAQDVAEGSEFGAYYHEQLAKKIFDSRPDLEDENEILKLAYGIAKSKLGSRAQAVFRDEDFAGDLLGAYQYLKNQNMSEAKYQGREVPLGKPMKGDVKKSKVYVRGPNGNVVKVNFGQKGMRIKKNIPGRRKNFRARHNCDNPGPRHKARFWSCRAW